MQLTNRINRPCKIHKLTVTTETRDDMGDPIASTDDSGVVTVCELQRALGLAGEEYRQGEQLTVSTYTLFLLPGEDLNGWSELTIAPEDARPDTWDGVTGERYCIEGEPDRVRHPRTGVVHHIEATVRKVR